MWSSSRSKPACTGHLRGAHEVVAHAVHVGRGPSRAAPGCAGSTARRRRETIGQLSAGSGSSLPSHSRRVEPLRPACASCMPILAGCRRARSRRCASRPPTCSGLYMPAQPGVMRASRLTSVISAITSPAPPTRAAAEVDEVPVVGRAVLGRVLAHRRDARRGSPARSSRSRNGVNIGGGGGVAGTRTPALPRGLAGEPASTVARRTPDRAPSGSRGVMRRLRVSRLKANWSGSSRPCSARSPRTTRGSPARRAAAPRPAGRRSASYAASAVGHDRVLARAPRASAIAVLHRELGARADREVRGVRGVAEQHDVAVCQRALRTVGKLRQSERFLSSGWPPSSSAKSCSQKAIVSSSSASSSPAARQVSSCTRR